MLPVGCRTVETVLVGEKHGVLEFFTHAKWRQRAATAQPGPRPRAPASAPGGGEAAEEAPGREAGPGRAVSPAPEAWLDVAPPTPLVA